MGGERADARSALEEVPEAGGGVRGVGGRETRTGAATTRGGKGRDAIRRAVPNSDEGKDEENGGEMDSRAATVATHVEEEEKSGG